MTGGVCPVRAFCVGQAKSGTASLAGLLSGHRTAHEPERGPLFDAIGRHDRGELTDEGLRRWLVERGHRLGLEFDIAWGNQFVAGALATAFPAARFIVLLRDPWTWLDSMVGHLLSREIPSEVRAFLDWWFRPEQFPPVRGDRGLVERGLPSTAAFVAAWVRHLDRCDRLLPLDRRLVIRTHELDRSHARLASFLGIDPASLVVARGHGNRRTFEGDPAEIVSPMHVDGVIQDLARPHLARVFPGVTRREEALRLWR